MPDLPDYYTQISALEAEAYSLRGGADASKSASPEARDVYLATDTDKLHYSIADGAWRAFFMSSRLLTANSLLYATTAYTPAALTVAASRFVGRKATGNIAAMTGAEAMALLSGQAAAAFSMNSQKITTLAAPTTDGDAARKKYVDDAIDTDIATHAALTATHGVSGAIVGTSDIQALTNKTLTSPTINGTIATTGLTMPTFILGGHVDMNGYHFTHLGAVTGRDATTTNPIYLDCERTDAGWGWVLRTLNAALDTQTVRMVIAHGADEATITWYNSNHTGIKLSGALNANSQQINNLPAPSAANDAATKAYVDACADTVAIKASATLRNSNDTERSKTNGTYTKLKETKLNADLAACRIKFAMKRDASGGSGFGCIYKNGSPIGTEREETAGNWTVYSEDLAGFVTDDLIQLYAKHETGGYDVFVKDFRFYYSEYITHIGGKDITTDLETETDPTISMTNQDP